jgi:hypothetical protein
VGSEFDPIYDFAQHRHRISRATVMLPVASGKEWIVLPKQSWGSIDADVYWMKLVPA